MAYRKRFVQCGAGFAPCIPPLAVSTLMPERFAGVTSDLLEGLRVALCTDRVLVALRELAARHLPALLAPLGLAARVGG